MRTKKLEEVKLQRKERNRNQQPQAEGLAKHKGKTSWRFR